MKLDDLKQNWQQQVVQKNQQTDELKESLSMLEQKIESMEKVIKRRDGLETIIALGLIPVWIIGLFLSASLIQTIGFIVAIISCLYIPYKLRKAKSSEGPKNTSIRAFLENERVKVIQQKRMLESVVWWYLGPLGLAIALITLGANVDEAGLPILTTMKTLYLTFVFVLYAGIYFMNKNAANKTYAPMLENIDNKLDALENKE